jgi:hypothetical protein
MRKIRNLGLHDSGLMEDDMGGSPSLHQTCAKATLAGAFKRSMAQRKLR